MDFVTRFIEFSRQHYEKIVLSLALLLLAGAVLGIHQASRNAKIQIDTYLSGLDRPRGSRIKPVNLDLLDKNIQQAQNPPPLALSSPHNLVNPVKWLRQADGVLIKNIKGTEATLDQLQITKISPLLLTITLDRFTGTGYMITTTNDAAVYPSPRRIPAYYLLNETNKPMFVLREVRGTQDNPTELVLEFKDSGERIVIAKGKSFVRTNAFEVELKYLNNKVFKAQRVNGVLNLGGEDYKIVAIAPHEVVFSAANDKKYAVPAVKRSLP